MPFYVIVVFMYSFLVAIVNSGMNNRVPDDVLRTYSQQWFIRAMFDICLASANNKTVMPAFNNLMDGVVKVAASCNKTIDRNDKVTRKMVVAALEEFKFFLMKTYTGSDERRQYDRSRKTAGVVSEFLNNVIDCVPYTTTNAHGSEGTRFRGDFTNSFVRGVDPFQLRNSN